MDTGWVEKCTDAGEIETLREMQGIAGQTQVGGSVQKTNAACVCDTAMFEYV